MSMIAKMQSVSAASLAHIDLLDDFMRLTQDKVTGQTDPFVRESLCELLDALRGERQGYVTLLGTPAICRAA